MYRYIKLGRWISVLVLFTLIFQFWSIEHVNAETAPVSVTYNGDKAAEVSEVTVESVTDGSSSCTPAKAYQIDLGEDYDGGALTLKSEAGQTLKYARFNLKAAVNISTSGVELTNADLQNYSAEALTFTGYTLEDGYDYYAMFSAVEDPRTFKLSFDNESALIIRVKKAEVDKTLLREALNNAPTEESIKYYHPGDFWNGITYLMDDNASFWSNYLEVRDAAEAVLDKDDATQDEVDEATDDLNAAVAALISKNNVNASELYALVDKTRRAGGATPGYGEESYGDTYDKYREAYDEAKDLCDSLYDDEGKPTDINVASKQNDVDAALAKLANAADNAWTTVSQRRMKRQYESGQKYLPELILLSDKLTSNGYTDESWTDFQAALVEAKIVSNKYASIDFPDTAPEARAAVKELNDTYDALYDSYYYGLTPTGEIEVSLIATDPDSARAGEEAGVSGYIGTVKLSEDYTVGAALTKAGIVYSSSDKAYVFINSIYASNEYAVEGGYAKDAKNIKLHAGDKVRVAWNMDPRSTAEQNQNPGGVEALLFQYLDSLNIMDFDENVNGATLEVKAGQEFTLTTKLINAALGSTDDWKVASNMSYFISNSAADDTLNQKELNKLMNGMDQVISDEDGKVNLTLYKEGCYVITAYDLEKDSDIGHLDGYKGLDTAGVYHSTNAGAIIRVKVLPADEEETAAAKAALIQELEEKAAEMPEEQFKPEDWATIQTALATGTEGINNAEYLGAARDAQQAAIKTIQQTQKAAREANEAALTAVRTALEKLPDDTSLISVSVDTLVQNLLSKYNEMTEYQKSLLTEEEIEKCEAIKARAASEDYQTPVTFKITVKNEADTKAASDALQAMADWINANPDQDGYAWNTWGNGDIVYSFKDPSGNIPNYLSAYQSITGIMNGTTDTVEPLKQVTLTTSLDFAAYLKVKTQTSRSFAVGDSGVTISDTMDDNTGMTFIAGSEPNYTANGHFTIMVGDTEYVLAGITYEGIDKSLVSSNSLTIHDYEGAYKGIRQKEGQAQHVHFPNSYVMFNMPFSDVTVTFEWEPVEIDTLKTNAKAAVNEAFDSYTKSDYFIEEQDELEAIRDTAIDEINEAELSTVVTSTKKQAIADMEAVKTKAEIKADAKEEIKEKFEAVDQSKMNDEEKAALAKAKENALKAVDDAADKKGLAKAGTDADSAFKDVVDASIARIAKEEADAQAADAVIAKIEALKEVSDLKLDDKSTVEAARTAYDALTDDQKALVPTADLQKLKNSEAMIGALQDKVDAEAEAAEAEKLKKAAEEAAKAAEQKQKEAEEAAKTAAEKQKAAEEAAKTAEQKQKEAEEAAKTAAQKQKEAEEAAKAAAEKQGESEEAAKIAAQKQKEAEEAAAIAAQKQKEAEETAKTAEQKQKEAEDAANAAEQKQKEAESAAKEAADKLKAAEEALKKAEEDLAKAEQNEFTALAKVKLSKKTKGSKAKITVRWTKVKGAKGYEILIAKNKKGTKSPLTYKAGKKASKKIIKKLKKGRYFVKVRAYKVIKGNTVYGKYSKAKKVSVK